MAPQVIPRLRAVLGLLQDKYYYYLSAAGQIHHMDLFVFILYTFLGFYFTILVISVISVPINNNIRTLGISKLQHTLLQIVLIQ